MIKHIVMWTLKENAEGNTKERNAVLIKEKLEALYGKVPQIKKIEVGINYRHEKEDYDVVLISEFETKKELDEYQKHPIHNIAAEFIGKVRDKRVCVDFETK
ncbi:MAG: Dabb family protein [archaeon]|jgi:hypothetical protein